jgi:colanic acid biosynthesis glycosyl transferase WcaI
MQSGKVLVITPQYTPDIGPSVPIYTTLCEDLQRMGYEVTVVTAFPHNTDAAALYQDKNGWFKEDKLNDVRIIRTYVYSVPKSALWRRLLYHASYNAFSTLAALRVRKPDIVLADAPTLWSGLPLIVNAIFQGIPYIYIVHDIYPDVLRRLSILTNPNLLQGIERIEQFFYTRSAQISVLSEGFKENLLHKGVPPEKITVIPACVDVEFIHPLPRENKLRERWGLSGKFVILYAGNIGLSQGLDVVLEAAGLLLNNPDIVFVLVGEGATKPALQQLADKSGLNNVKFFPFQPRQEVPMVYALADVCLVSLKRDIVVESVPSKTYTIMASGRPIIAAVAGNTEVSYLLDQAQCGLCIEPENPKSLVEAILKLFEANEIRREMGRCGRAFVVEYFSQKVASNKYSALIQKFSRKHMA